MKNAESPSPNDTSSNAAAEQFPADSFNDSVDNPTLTATPSAASLPRPAGFWIRFWAKLSDRFLLGVAVYPLYLLLALLHTYGTPGLNAFLFILITMGLLEIFYFAYFNSNGRQTFGYRWAGLRAEMVNHQPVGWWRSFCRSLITFIFWMAAWLWIGLVDQLSVAFSRSKRALHDYATGTQVVRIATPRKNALALSGAGIFLLLALQFLTRDFLVQAYYIPSGAMENTLQINDRILVNRLCYRLRDPRVNELIVFSAPATSGSGGQDFIKRCVGVPGDVIEMKGRQLYRNGQAIKEPHVKWGEQEETAIYGYDMKIVDGQVYSRDYILPDTPGLWAAAGMAPLIPAPNQGHIDNAKPEAVPTGQYLMFGDYRNNSNDSHVWGFVPKNNLHGPAMFIFWPLERLKNL